MTNFIIDAFFVSQFAAERLSHKIHRGGGGVIDRVNSSNISCLRIYDLSGIRNACVPRKRCLAFFTSHELTFHRSEFVDRRKKKQIDGGFAQTRLDAHDSISATRPSRFERWEKKLHKFYR